MVFIELTEKQLLNMKPEIERAEMAEMAEKEGMLLLQVWFKDGVAEGGFIPNKPAVEIQKIAREYHV